MCAAADDDGCLFTSGEQDIGFQSSTGSAGGDVESIVMPYVDLLADFREDVRNIAREERVTKILKVNYSSTFP